MAISRIFAATNVTAAYATSLTLNITGLGHVAGDILICCHTTGFASAPTDPPVPTGFTRLGWSGGASYVIAGYKVADGTETNIVFGTQAGDNTSHAVGIVCYRGAGTPAGGQFPTQASSINVITGPTVSTVPAGGVTVNIGMSCPSSSGSCTVTVTNWTERFDVVGATSFYRNMVFADNPTNTGSVAGATFTFTTTATTRTQACGFYLPASAALAVYPLLMSM